MWALKKSQTLGPCAIFTISSLYLVWFFLPAFVLAFAWLVLTQYLSLPFLLFEGFGPIDFDEYDLTGKLGLLLGLIVYLFLMTLFFVGAVFTVFRKGGFFHHYAIAMGLFFGSDNMAKRRIEVVEGQVARLVSERTDP